MFALDQSVPMDVQDSIIQDYVDSGYDRQFKWQEAFSKYLGNDEFNPAYDPLSGDLKGFNDNTVSSHGVHEKHQHVLKWLDSHNIKKGSKVYNELAKAGTVHEVEDLVEKLDLSDLIDHEMKMDATRDTKELSFNNKGVSDLNVVAQPKSNAAKVLKKVSTEETKSSAPQVDNFLMRILKSIPTFLYAVLLVGGLGFFLHGVHVESNLMIFTSLAATVGSIAALHVLL